MKKHKIQKTILEFRSIDTNASQTSEEDKH